MARFLKLRNGDLVNHEAVDNLRTIESLEETKYYLDHSHGYSVKLSKEEYDKYSEELNSTSKTDSSNKNLTEEIKHLTMAIRDLWNLLRARLR